MMQDHEVIQNIEKLVAEESLEDKALVLPTEPTRSVFGMAQSLAETPRSATVVPSSLLDSLGIREAGKTQNHSREACATSQFRLSVHGLLTSLFER